MSLKTLVIWCGIVLIAGITSVYADSNATITKRYCSDTELLIPYTIVNADANLDETYLLYTTDNGISWNVYDRIWRIKRDEENVCVFDATRVADASAIDGDYGFTIVSANRLHSSTITGKPRCIIIVDTTEPEVHISVDDAESTGEDTPPIIRWKVTDDNFLTGSVVLEYQEEAGSVWKPIAEMNNKTGYFEWIAPPPAPRTYNIRARAKDKAGNTGYSEIVLVSIQGAVPSGTLENIPHRDGANEPALNNFASSTIGCPAGPSSKETPVISHTTGKSEKVSSKPSPTRKPCSAPSKEDLQKAETCFERACVFYNQNKYAEAIGSLKQAIALNGEDARYYFRLANIYVKKRNLTEAIEYYSLAVRIDSTNTRYLKNLGLAYSDGGYYDSAIEIFERLHSMDKSDKIVILELWKLYDIRKCYKQACRLLKNALATVNFNEEIQRKMKRYVRVRSR